MDRRTFAKLAASAGALGLIGSYPVLIEPYVFTVNKFRIPVPNLPDAFEGFTIVHLTDLHYGPLVPMSFLEKITRRANSIPRDLTVCTGDYVHERNGTRLIDGIWPQLCELRAPYGVFSVLGNHDHWADTDRSILWLKKSGQDLRLQARHVSIKDQKLWFVGAGDLWEDHCNLDYPMRDIPDQDCRIVLAHNPDSIDTDYNKRIDLAICGHTHGGQVNIPFYGAPVLPVKNRNYSYGLKKSKTGYPVFISRGIGWAIYPVRFNCNPEIAVLTLTKTGEPERGVGV